MSQNMKAVSWAAFAGIVAAGALWLGVAHAQVVRQYDASGISVSTVSIKALVDGGCTLSVCGVAVSVDGGGALPLCVNDFKVQRPAFAARCQALAQAGAVLLSASLGTGNDGGAP